MSLQVSETFSDKCHKKTLAKEPAPRNTDARKTALFRALLPQLFAQFDEHSDAEPLTLLNTHGDAESTTRITYSSTNRTTIQPANPLAGISTGIIT
ncbi:MAG: hypothetical protein E7007_03245 [Alphaproteobacteria bacterium]|nr:hypothetical protein [Alphaproteobacteria bacterium]